MCRISRFHAPRTRGDLDGFALLPLPRASPPRCSAHMRHSPQFDHATGRHRSLRSNPPSLEPTRSTDPVHPPPRPRGTEVRCTRQYRHGTHPTWHARRRTNVRHHTRFTACAVVSDRVDRSADRDGTVLVTLLRIAMLGHRQLWSELLRWHRTAHRDRMHRLTGQAHRV